MTQFLPPNLLALFAARDPIPYLPPADKLSWEKRTDGYTGIAHLVDLFEDPKDTPPPTVAETREERLERKRKEKAEQMAYKLEQEIAMWDPNANAGTTDPYKSLFVARINYDTSESKLRREFEIYGPIKKIVVVHNNKSGKPRGYAFIEYEHERDMHSAYKHADGKKLDNRRVLVDVERARTVKGWLPRRLGGGLGGTRRGGPDVNIKHSGREDDRKKREDDHERPERSDSRHRERHHSRDRSRERVRESDRRRKRSRSRDRKRRRSRSREREGGDESRSRRHRSRSRDRKRRSSRSKERKHRRDRDRGDRNRGGETEEGSLGKVKQEPEDDYPDYSNQESYYNNIPLKDEEERIQRIKNGVKYEEDEDQQIQHQQPPPMINTSLAPPPPPPPPPPPGPHPQHMENEY